LGGALAGQQKCPEAEPLCLEGYDEMKAQFGRIPVHQRQKVAEALDRVVRLYEAWGKKEKAEAWRKKYKEVASQGAGR
jgi:hypothetical protein